MTKYTSDEIMFGKDGCEAAASDVIVAEKNYPVGRYDLTVGSIACGNCTLGIFDGLGISDSFSVSEPYKAKAPEVMGKVQEILTEHVPCQKPADTQEPQ